MKHFKHCYVVHVKYRIKRAKFEEKYPNYCHRCLGFGKLKIESSDRIKLKKIPCPDCFAKDLCPRCKNLLTEIKADTFRYVAKCSVCGWNEHVPKGCPRKPDCNCKQLRKYRKKHPYERRCPKCNYKLEELITKKGEKVFYCEHCNEVKIGLSINVLPEELD